MAADTASFTVTGTGTNLEASHLLNLSANPNPFVSTACLSIFLSPDTLRWISMTFPKGVSLLCSVQNLHPDLMLYNGMEEMTPAKLFQLACTCAGFSQEELLRQLVCVY